MSHALCLIYVLPALLLFFLSVPPSYSAESDETSSLIEYLVQQKSVQTVKLNEIKNISLPESMDEFDQLSDKIDVLYALNQVNQANLNNLLSEQKNELEKLNKKLKQVHQTKARAYEKNIGEKNKGLRIQIQVYEEAVELIQDNLVLCSAISESLNNKQKSLRQWKEQYKTKLKIKSINSQIELLKQKITNIYKENIKLQQKKNEASENNLDIQFESELMLNNQQALLLYSKVSILEQQKKQFKANTLMSEEVDGQNLESIKSIHLSVISRLNAVENDLTQIQKVLTSDGVPTRISNSSQYDKLKIELSETIDKAVSVKTTSKLRAL